MPSPCRRLTALLAAAVLAASGCGNDAPAPCALRTAGAQWLAFSSKRTGNYDVYAMREDGTCLTPVTNDAGDDLFATWSPAGTIAYMSARSGRMQIYVRDFTTGAERQLDVGDLTATSPAFSPDGALVAFEGYEPGVTSVADIYVVPSAGGVPAKLTTSQRYSAGPAWSPDGATLYFVSNRVGGYNVWTVPSTGGAETMLAGTAGVLGRPAVTPDGAGIVFTLPAAGAAFSKVVVLDLSTGAVRTVSSQSDGEPTVDRTGARLVVTSARGGGADLWVLDMATGAEVRQLTAQSGDRRGRRVRPVSLILPASVRPVRQAPTGAAHSGMRIRTPVRRSALLEGTFRMKVESSRESAPAGQEDVEGEDGERPRPAVPASTDREEAGRVQGHPVHGEWTDSGGVIGGAG